MCQLTETQYKLVSFVYLLHLMLFISTYDHTAQTVSNEVLFFCYSLGEASPPCSGCLAASISAHIPAVQLDNAYQFNIVLGIYWGVQEVRAT